LNLGTLLFSEDETGWQTKDA